MFVGKLQRPTWHRWINGNGKAMKDSASYPLWFGRAWVFIHETMEANTGSLPSTQTLHTFAEMMIERMFVDEEAAGSDVDFGPTLIMLWGTVCTVGTHVHVGRPVWDVKRTAFCSTCISSRESLANPLNSGLGIIVFCLDVSTRMSIWQMRSFFCQYWISLVTWKSSKVRDNS